MRKARASDVSLTKLHMKFFLQFCLSANLNAVFRRSTALHKSQAQIMSVAANGLPQHEAICHEVEPQHDAIRHEVNLQHETARYEMNLLHEAARYELEPQHEVVPLHETICHEVEPQFKKALQYQDVMTLPILSDKEFGKCRH